MGDGFQVESASADNKRGSSLLDLGYLGAGQVGKGCRVAFIVAVENAKEMMRNEFLFFLGRGGGQDFQTAVYLVGIGVDDLDGPQGFARARATAVLPLPVWPDR